MYQNPEFKRNCWIELTPVRLFVTPIFCLFFFVLLQILSSYDRVANFALTCFVLVTILYGARKSFKSVLNEVSENTWDNQRMTGMEPSTLLIGKLFGSTIFTWYAGFCCLIVYMLAKIAIAFNLPNLQDLFTQSQNLVLSHGVGGLDTSVESLTIILYFILVALIFQGATFLYSLNYLKSPDQPNAFLGLVILALFFSQSVSLISLFGALFQGPTNLPFIAWFGDLWPSRIFSLISLGLFVGWILVGNLRVMSELLQVRSVPWASLAFLIFLNIYLSGFKDTKNGNSYLNFVNLGMTLGGLLTYPIIFFENRSWSKVRTIFQTWRESGLSQKSLEITPSWLPTFIYTFFCAIIFALLEWSNAEITLFSSTLANFYLKINFLDPISISILILRDICLLYYLSLIVKSDRVVFSALFSFFILYIFAPMVFKAVGLGFLILPISTALETEYTKSNLIYILPIIAICQASLIAIFFWKKINGDQRFSLNNQSLPLS